VLKLVLRWDSWYDFRNSRVDQKTHPIFYLVLPVLFNAFRLFLLPYWLSFHSHDQCVQGPVITSVLRVSGANLRVNIFLGRLFQDDMDRSCRLSLWLDNWNWRHVTGYLGLWWEKVEHICCKLQHLWRYYIVRLSPLLAHDPWKLKIETIKYMKLFYKDP
jgi:hypothetical protein